MLQPTLHLTTRPGKWKDLTMYEQLDQEYVGSNGQDPVLKLLSRQQLLVDRVILGNYFPIGYFIFTPEYESTEIVRFAIDRDYWGRGIGKRILSSFIAEQKDHRKKIVVKVPENNIGAQFFFKSMGFKAPTRGAVKELGLGTSVLLMEFFIQSVLSLRINNQDIRFGG